MNQFLEACGATESLRVAVDLPGSGETAREVHTFDLPFAIVGRDPSADLRLDHPEISDRHAYLQLINGRLVVIDLGSRVGIHQGGKRKRFTLLQGEPATRVGPYRLRKIGDSQSSDDDAEPSEVAANLLAKSGPGGSVLDLSHRSSRRSRIEIQGGIALLGSGADCHVRFIDPSVSTFHCALVQTEAGTWLVDLLGKGGIKVNGLAVNHAKLLNGDEAQLGASSFRVESLYAAARESARLGVARNARPKPTLNADGNRPTLLAMSELQDAPVATVSVSKSSPTVDQTPPIDVPAFPSVSDPQETTVAQSRETSLAKTEVGATASELAAVQAADIVERMMVPLADQLGMIRREMLEELHQAHSMMFETFNTLQEEQTAAFQSELERLRDIAQDLEAHRAGLERQAEKIAETLVASSSLPPVFQAQGTKALAFHEAVPPRETVNIPRASDTMVEGFRAVIKPHDEAIHNLLCDRISKLKEEHQSRWQKLLGIFPSMSAGKSSG